MGKEDRFLDSKTCKELKRILGPHQLKLDWETRVCYGYDATNQLFVPHAVCFPEDTSQVSRILELASAKGIPVVPRGAGSGFTGGALPVLGGLVLSTERMNRILSISQEDLVAVVQPGVVTGVFQKVASGMGLFYPPDPASQDFSTLGGNVAECAGGMRALKYGVTRDYVLGLEVVLPTGSIVRTGGRTVKHVVGYDLTRLMVGSEGTLGIITEITLKLIPLPEARRTVLVFFPSIKTASLAVTKIFSEGVLPSAMELVDRACLDCVAQSKPVRFPAETAAMLLVEVDGSRLSVEEQAAKVARVCHGLGSLELQVSQDEAQAESLWSMRKAISPALARIRPHRLNEDVVVPRSLLPEAMERFSKIGEQWGVPVTAFGHAGDGNIHVNVLYDRSDPQEAQRAEKAAEAVMRATVELGGSLSGEHGIGTTKARFLSLEIHPQALELMCAIKALLDPRGILNPGKIFPQRGKGALA